MNTEKSNEFVNDIKGDVAETGLDVVNNNPGVDASNEAPDVGNLAVTMSYLDIDNGTEFIDDAEDVGDELDSYDLTGAAALPMEEDPEISQWTARITEAVELTDAEIEDSDNPEEDWGQKWMFEMKMVNRKMAPVSMTPATTVGTINERLTEGLGEAIVYFGFQYDDDGPVIPADPTMTVGELAKMEKITLGFEFHDRYERIDD